MKALLLLLLTCLSWSRMSPCAEAQGDLRVGLVEAAASVLLGSSVAARLCDERGATVATIGALEGWQAGTDGRRVLLRGPRGTINTYPGPLRLVFAEASAAPLIFVQKRWYRGTIELRPAPRGLSVVNRLSLEHYLYGVVTSEMPSGWPLEALKSQAIASRSYALSSLGKHASHGYDVCDTDECQVYHGASGETSSGNQAVEQTRAQVLVFNRRVIPAYFHSSAGGFTENSEDVWSQRLPYIRAVPDYDQASPQFTWYKTVRADQLSGGLSRCGVDIGQLLQVVPMSRSTSGRVRDVQVVGSEGSRVLKGETFRIAAGLNSTLFNVAPDGTTPPGEFVFAGRGWGHGLGMSQYGAKTLAEKGLSYGQILGHYYPGVQLEVRGN